MAVNVALIVGVGVLIALVMVALIAVYAARYKKSQPNRALVVFGVKYQPGSRFRVILSGGRFIQPIVESHGWVSLAPVRVETHIDVTTLGAGGPAAASQVDVLATVKVPAEEGAVEKAAEHFLQAGQYAAASPSHDNERQRKAEDVMRQTVSDVLERVARATLASAPPGMPGPEIAARVSAAVTPDLERFGLDLISLTVTTSAVGAPRSTPASSIEVARELERINARLGRVEARLGLAPPR